MTFPNPTPLGLGNGFRVSAATAATAFEAAGIEVDR